MSLPQTALLAILLACPPAGGLPAMAKERPVYVENGYAIGGYDAVAYFFFGKAMKGSPEHALIWRGATWLFVSEDTMLAFEMDPQAYAPQFGGYCAYGVAQGKLVRTNPELFTIVDGRLYLSRDRAAQAAWDADAEAHATVAQDNWPAVLGR